MKNILNENENGGSSDGLHIFQVLRLIFISGQEKKETMPFIDEGDISNHLKMYRSSNRREEANEIMADGSSRYSSFSNKVNNINMLGYLIDRSTNARGNSTKRFTKQLWETAKDLYKKDLTAHYGCVNAIEFSNDGNHLFSGGDDQRVLMWNVNHAMMHYTRKLGDGSKPSVMRACHFSNIFCLAVDDDNKRILSGSNDDQVIVHDYRTGNPVDYFVHDSPVFSLSLYPMNGNIFASAADNGKISVYDIRRSNADPFCLARFRTPFHGVMFNPFEPSLVATANSKVGIHIWDLRRPKEILYECSDEQSMSVRWNQCGTILLALRNLLPPVIYNPRYPKKKLEFDADGYYNACTMKSCSFAGDNDEYILSGSDDFNLYMWKIPEPWPQNRWIPKAHLTLIGHRSIVNQVRYDRNKQLIASSGVEKIIKIWSPLRMPYSEGDHDRPCQKGTRYLCCSKSCARSPGFLSHDYSQESVDEDMKMIHFFDSLLRNELSTNTQSQVYCVDGRLFPISSRRNESKVYEQLINRKKKYLLKLLTRKCDDNFPVCSLSQVPVSRDDQMKKYQVYLEGNQLSDDSNESESDLDIIETTNISPVIETAIPISPLPSPTSRSSSSLSSMSSSTFCSPSSSASERSSLNSSARSSPNSSSQSSNYSSSAIESSHSGSFLDPAYGSESQHSSENLSEAFSQDGSSAYGFDLSQSPGQSSNSETDDSEDVGENTYGSNNYKDSGVNVSASSDSETAAGCSSLKRKRITKKNRSYRNSKRKRSSYSSSNSSETESCSQRKSESEMGEVRHFGSRYAALNGICTGWEYDPDDFASDISN